MLFWEHGYEATGISKLESALNAGRQSIYNLFGDKKSLFLKAYQHYLDTRLHAAIKLLEKGDSPQSKLRNLFYNSLDCSSVQHFGCFIGNTIATPSGNAEEVEAITSRAIENFIQAFRSALSPLFSDLERLDSSAWSFFTLFQGAQLIAKQQSNRSHLLKAIDLQIDNLSIAVEN